MFVRKSSYVDSRDSRIQEINLRQFHQYARLGRMEKDIKSLQHFEIPGSSAKDPAPMESKDD